MPNGECVLTPTRAVAAATVLYAIAFSLLGADRYATFHAGADLGLFAQSIAAAANGLTNTFEGGSHFAYHFSPILYALAPVLWVTHSAVSLVAVQALATALVAPALYAIARRRTSDRNAAGLACIALLYPPLHGVTFTDFHEVAFVPATIAWLLWAIDARRFWLAIALVAFALCVKEDQGPSLAFLGVVAAIYFARNGERAGAIFGAATALLSAAVFGAYFGIVRPLAGVGGHWAPSHFYAWKGYSDGHSLSWQIVARVSYLLEAFVPLALLPFRSPALLLALPGFAEVLASREPLTFTMGQHYAAVWVPYVLVAFALGGAALLERATNAARWWVRTSAILCVAVSVFFSPLHLTHFLRPLDDRDAATNALIDRIPIAASVGTYDEIYAHLGFYRNAQVGLKGLPDYVIEDRQYASATWNGTWLPQLRAAIARGDYAVVQERDGVVLYQRTVR